MMRKTSTETNIRFASLLLAIIFSIGVAWQLLEMFFYGEVQPRVVDDCVTLLWVAAVVFVYRWTKEQTIGRCFAEPAEERPATDASWRESSQEARQTLRETCEEISTYNPGPLASDSDWEMRLHSNGENVKTGEVWR